MYTINSDTGCTVRPVPAVDYRATSDRLARLVPLAKLAVVLGFAISILALLVAL